MGEEVVGVVVRLCEQECVGDTVEEEGHREPNKVDEELEEVVALEDPVNRHGPRTADVQIEVQVAPCLVCEPRVAELAPSDTPTPAEENNNLETGHSGGSEKETGSLWERTSVGEEGLPRTGRDPSDKT